jgi:hypothetical protein
VSNNVDVAKEVVEDFVSDMTRILKFGEIQAYENMAVIPLILQDQGLDFITIREAEELEVAWIQEQVSELVGQLEAVNVGEKPVLIPFLQTVKGGKQDRTVYEPILIPAGRKKSNPLSIPARCIEASRWTYGTQLDGGRIQFDGGKETRKFKTSGARMNQSISRRLMETQGDQSMLWDSVEAYSELMRIERSKAPTRSYLDMIETKQEEIEEYLSKFKDVEGQCGITVLVDGEVIAYEFYGNQKAWKDFRTDVLKGYISETLLRQQIKEKSGKEEEKKEKISTSEAHRKALETLSEKTSKIEPRKGTGLGYVVEFSSSDGGWHGITLINENKIAHFYAVGKSSLEKIKPRRVLETAQVQRILTPEEISRNLPPPTPQQQSINQE